MNQKLWLLLCILAFILLCFVCLRTHDHAPTATTVTTPAPALAVTDSARLEGKMEDGKIILSGIAPTMDVKTALVSRARTLYGTDKVIDNISVDTKLSPGGWDGGLANLAAILGGRLSNGAFILIPGVLTIRGTVQGEDVRQSIIRAATNSVTPNVRVVDELTVISKSAEQAGIDDFLKGKTIEFATASAVITPKGRQILDQVTPYLQKADGKSIEISGHTDSEGAADLNMKLSNERAAAVKQYLTGKGLPPARLSTVGYGPSRPVADNATPEGRQQNRRIEFAIQ